MALVNYLSRQVKNLCRNACIISHAARDSQSQQVGASGWSRFRCHVLHLLALLPLQLLDLHQAGRYCRIGPVPHS